MNILQKPRTLKLKFLNEGEALLETNVRLYPLLRGILELFLACVAAGVGVIFLTVLTIAGNTKLYVSIGSFAVTIFLVTVAVTNFTDKAFLFINKEENLIIYKKRKFGVYMKTLGNWKLTNVQEFITKKEIERLENPVSDTDSSPAAKKTRTVHRIVLKTNEGDIDTFIFPYANKPKKTIKALNNWIKDKEIESKVILDGP